MLDAESSSESLSDILAEYDRRKSFAASVASHSMRKGSASDSMRKDSRMDASLLEASVHSQKRVESSPLKNYRRDSVEDDPDGPPLVDKTVVLPPNFALMQGIPEPPELAMVADNEGPEEAATIIEEAVVTKQEDVEPEVPHPIRVLRKLALFRVIHLSDFLAMSRNERCVSFVAFPVGTVLAQQGTSRCVRGYHVIVAGCVSVEKLPLITDESGSAPFQSTAERAVSIGELSTGDTFGDVRSIAAQPSPVTLCCLTHVEAIAVSDECLLQVDQLHRMAERRRHRM